MKIIFRTDSSLQIGSGHVMRCLTLADELRLRGADVTFVCREHPGNLISLIEGKGYPVVHLKLIAVEYVAKPDDVQHAGWLGGAWEQDAADTIDSIGDLPPQWLIVDHYSIDRRWEHALRPHAGKIMVIDDIADRPHDCELLLDQNLYQKMETRYANLIPLDCKKLLGPRYALLKPEFLVARNKLRQRDGQIQRVLVSFGGVDPTNETEKAILALASITSQTLEVDVVVGGGNLHKERIQKLCAAHDGFHYHCQVNNMADLMATADLSIGTGGTTVWERCALGLPSLVSIVANNHEEQVSFCAEQGILFCLGNQASVTTQHILNAFKVFSFSTFTLRSFSSASMKLVDALGVKRVAGFLISPQVKIRTAQESDCDAIYEWRNAEETRKYIFVADIIPLETHRIWFKNTLTSHNRVLLIGEINDHPIGVVRYDFSGDNALISVYLAPGAQLQGIGTELIRSGSRWLKQNRTEIKTIAAEIMRENIASMRAFEKAGYQEHHVTCQEVLK